MSGRSQGEDLGLQSTDIFTRQVRGIRKNADMHSVSRKDGEVVRVWRDDELSNIVGYCGLDGL